jgi:hypothetical protein
MRDRFPLLLLGLVVLTAALGWVLLQGARRGAFADRLSTFRSSPDGARALYLVLEAQHLDVARWQRPLDELPPGAPLLLLGVSFPGQGREALDGGAPVERPQAPMDERELARLLAHVEAGATLVYAPGDLASGGLLEALGVSLTPTGTPADSRTLVPAQPSVFTRGVERVETPVLASLRLPPEAVPLLLDGPRRQTVAALVAHGSGRVLVLGAPELFTNRQLARADNARFLTGLVRELGQSQRVLFDEVHHGFGGGRSLGDFAARWGLHLAAAQLLLGLALWALSLRRFGAARPPLVELRLDVSDALGALARLYREGRHHGHAARSLVLGLCADLCGTAGVRSGSPPAEVARGLARRGHPALARAVTQLADLAPRVASDRELLELARLSALSRRLP